MELSKDTLTKLERFLKPEDVATVVSALKEDPPKADWKIEGKHNLDDDWIHLGSIHGEDAARKWFDLIKSDLGGFYRLISPQKVVVAEHPENLWSLPQKLKRLNITAPPDWNDYNTYLLSGGKLEYEDWKAAGS